MSKVRVEKSVLRGEVTISGAKNSSLRLLAASILTDKNIELTDDVRLSKNFVITNSDFQVERKEDGKKIIAETRGWDDNKNITKKAVS